MKKLKWGLLTCLTVTSSVIPMLSTTACGKKTEEVNKIGDEYDKEYGVDQAVYTKMKNEFWNKVETKLRHEGATEDEIDRERKDLNETFTDYDNQLASNPQLSYTVITNAMIDFASQTYKIKLTRSTAKKTATWDDLTAAFEGMVQSMNQYMISSSISESQRLIILQKAREDFEGVNGLKARIREQYDDPLLGLIKAKGEMLSCFSDINYDIGLVAASNRLKNFMEDYDIEYDERDDQSNKLDKLEAKDWFTVGADLSKNDRILNIYKITRKSDGKALEHFEPDKVCPSYTVKPILKKINKNLRQNVYTLSIDWTCVKTLYLQSNDSELAEKTTAHYFNPDINALGTKDVTSAYDALKECSKESAIDYPISLTKDGERQAIAETYFNDKSTDGYISLGWDANPQGEDMNGFDGLFSGTPLQDHENGATGYEYFIGHDSLALSGLTIAYNNVEHPDRETTPIRFDDLVSVSGVNAKVPDKEKYNEQDQLVKDFLTYCVPWSDTKPHETQTTNSGFYSATSSVYVDYTNSEYDPMIKDSSGNYTSYRAVRDMEVTNYQISTHSYDYLTGAYNEQDTFVTDYKTSAYQESYDSAKTDGITETVFIALSLLFTVQTTAMCAAPVFLAKIPIYCIMLAIAWISMAGQVAMLSMIFDRKVKPLKGFVDSNDKVKNSQELKTFDNEIQQSREANHLCRYDPETHIIKKADYEDAYHKFMDNADFFEDVLPTMEYYQNVYKLKSYQDLYEVVEDHKVDPKSYQDSMHVWDKKGSCTIGFYCLLSATVVLDISLLVLLFKCPELSNWTLMKKAITEARESGATTSSVIETYKRLKQTADYIKAVEKALKSGKSSLSSLSKLSAHEAYDFINSNKIGFEMGDAYKVAESTGKGFAGFLDSCAETGASMQDISEILQKMVDAGKGGFSGVLGTLSGFSKTGKFTSAGELCLSQAFEYFEDIIRGDVCLASLRSASTGFANIYKGLTDGARQLLKAQITAGIRSLQLGRSAEAFQFLKNIDSIIFDAQNLTATMRMSSKFVFSQMSESMKAIYASINRSSDFLFEQIWQFCKFFVT